MSTSTPPDFNRLNFILLENPNLDIISMTQGILGILCQYFQNLMGYTFFQNFLLLLVTQLKRTHIIHFNSHSPIIQYLAWGEAVYLIFCASLHLGRHSNNIVGTHRYFCIMKYSLVLGIVLVGFSGTIEE